MGEQLLNSPTTAAERLDRSRSFVYAEMAEGRLRYVVLGKRRMIPESALIEYLESLESSAA